MIYHRDTGYVDAEGNPLIEVTELTYFCRGVVHDNITKCDHWLYILQPKNEEGYIFRMPYKCLNLS